jgi:hypothetical protein
MPRSDKPFEGIGGGGGISPTATRDILKRAITIALAKRAASGQSSKTIIKNILNSKEVQKTNLTQKDIAQGLYNFYKKNPKYDTSVKSTMTTPKKPADVVAARIAAERVARAKRLEEGTSPRLVRKPKPRTKSVGAVKTITEREKAMAKAALKRERKQNAIANKKQAKEDAKKIVQTDSAGRVIGSTTKGKLKQLNKVMKKAASNPKNSPGVPEKQPTIESRTAPRPSDELALKDETANINRALGTLSKEEKAVYRLIQERVNAGMKPRKPDMPKPKKVQSVDERLANAKKKLTPAQIRKIEAIVAETKRRALG